MKFKKINPPRSFSVGFPSNEIILSHVMDLELAADEQGTFLTSDGRELDLCRMSCGYYAVPSLNGRLKKFGYRSCLINSGNRRYLHLVENERMNEYLSYVSDQNMEIVAWLDGEEIEWVKT